MARFEWQAAPGWPEPPAGWSPPPGWQLDPSWPPHPPGWRWWQKHSRPRWLRVVRWSVGGLLIAVGGVLIAAEVVDSVTGCGSADPTDPADYASASIVNDTRVPVTVSDCRGDYCNPNSPRTRLLPGQHVTVHGACGVSGADMTSWRLTRDNGAFVGFIAIGTRRSRAGVVYDVSAATGSRAVAARPAEQGTTSR